jgi:hypothetical protein
MEVTRRIVDHAKMRSPGHLAGIRWGHRGWTEPILQVSLVGAENRRVLSRQDSFASNTRL